MLVWDFDGTLADTFDGIHVSLDETLVRHGYDPVDASRLRPLVGLNLRLVFARLVGGDDELATTQPDLIASLVKTYRAVNLEIGPPRSKLFPGIAPLLEQLRADGVTSTIATSKARSGIWPTLDHLGITDHFAAVISDDDVANKKPHPDMVLAACAAVDATPDQALVIGDTVFDLEMGQRAGTATCAVTWGNQPRDQLAGGNPTYLVETVAELTDVCHSALAADTRP